MRFVMWQRVISFVMWQRVIRYALCDVAEGDQVCVV